MSKAAQTRVFTACEAPSSLSWAWHCGLLDCWGPGKCHAVEGCKPVQWGQSFWGVPWKGPMQEALGEFPVEPVGDTGHSRGIPVPVEPLLRLPGGDSHLSVSADNTRSKKPPCPQRTVRHKEVWLKPLSLGVVCYIEVTQYLIKGSYPLIHLLYF